MLDSVRKHALVIILAILFATYRLSRLEGVRGRRSATVEQDFESAVEFLRRHLDSGKYQVLRIAPPPSYANKLQAMVVNRAFAIPHIEAEVFVDQKLAFEQRKQSRRDHRSQPSVRFRMHDAAAMTPVAEALRQKNLIVSYEQGYQPS